MKYLEEKLTDFEIDTVEKMIDFFLTCHEYSFTTPVFKESKIKPKDLFLGYANSLNHVSDLERLWYGLELKYLLFLVDEFPLFLFKNSINKILKDINTVDIEVLRLQTETLSNVVLDEDIKGLIVRPSMLIEDDEESMFYPIGITVEKYYNFIDKHRKHIASTKVKKYKILPPKITQDYIDDDTVIVEIWSLLLQGYFLDKLYPTILSKLDNNDSDSDVLSIDIVLDQDEMIELSDTMIEAVFKNTKLSDTVLFNMFNELTSINVETLSNLLCDNLNV